MFYKIQVATDSEFQNIVFGDTNTDENFEEIFQNLDYATLYYWRVKTINEMDGSESAWSTPCMFVTKGADISVSAGPTKIYYSSYHNREIYNGHDCHLIGFNLNDLSYTVNYPVSSSNCQFIGFDIGNLSARGFQ